MWRFGGRWMGIGDRLRSRNLDGPFSWLPVWVRGWLLAFVVIENEVEGWRELFVGIGCLGLKTYD